MISIYGFPIVINDGFKDAWKKKKHFNFINRNFNCVQMAEYFRKYVELEVIGDCINYLCMVPTKITAKKKIISSDEGHARL